MDKRWYQNAVIDRVEIDVFRDGNGEGPAAPDAELLGAPAPVPGVRAGW